MFTFSNRAEVLLIGIAGPSCSGKSTYAQHLVDHLRSPIRAISLDEFYIRGIPINHPILGQTINEELPKTSDVQRLIRLLEQIKSHATKATRYHRSGVRTDNHRPVVVVVEGFILFALSNELTNLFDIRVLFEAHQHQCRLRRYRREYRVPTHIADDELSIPASFRERFDHLVWAEYLKRRDLQLSQVQKTFSSDQYHQYQYGQIDECIDKCLEDVVREKRKNT